MKKVLMIAAPVADHEVGHTSEQLAAKGKMPTERTSAVVNEGVSHSNHSDALRELSAAAHQIFSAGFSRWIEAQALGDDHSPAFFGSFP